MKSFYLFLVLSITAHAQTSLPQALTREASQALTHPNQVGAVAQKIQNFFSNPKNKILLETKEVKELVQLQFRLINYLRLEQDLRNGNCNIDRTRNSDMAIEILNITLNVEQCSELSPYAFADHTKISSLITEQKMNEGHYTGEYAIGPDGEIVFPGGNTAKEKEKYLWRVTLPEVVLVKDGKLTSKVLEHPTTFDPPKKELIAELYRQSLINAFQTYMNLHTTYGIPKLSVPTVVNEFCTKNRMLKKDLECSPSIKKFLTKKAQEALKLKKAQSFESAAKELNVSIVKLNALRAKLEKNTTYVDGYSKLLIPKWIDEKQAKRDYTEYESLYNKMISSGPGLFVATDQLHSDLKRLQFEPINFILTPTSYPKVTSKNFVKAVEEAQDLTIDHAHELLKIYHKNKSDDEKVLALINLNPAATSKILLNRPEFGPMVCNGLRNISIDDDNDRQLRLVATWGGTIVGGALIASGIGSGVGVGMLGGAGSVAMAPSLVLTYDQLQDSSSMKNASIAEGNGLKAETKVTEHEQVKSDFKTLAVFSSLDLIMAMRMVKVVGAASEVAAVEKLSAPASGKAILLEQNIPKVS